MQLFKPPPVTFLSVLIGFSILGPWPACADDKLYPFLGVPQVAKAQTPADPVNLPKGSSATPLRLAADSWYVVDCKVDCIVYGSQIGTGRIKIVAESGPIRLRGKFSDGGSVETRKFDGPFVYVVEAASTGPCELSVIPKGLKEEGEIFRRLIDVALNPIPPPEPKPPTPPAPGPNPLPSDKLRVMMTYESSDTLTAAQSGVLRSIDVHKAISAAGGQWRCWDNGADASAEEPFWQAATKRGRAAMGSERNATPWVIISSPKGFWEGPLPPTVAAFIGQIKKVGG